jgi:hypothetical protein
VRVFLLFLFFFNNLAQQKKKEEGPHPTFSRKREKARLPAMRLPYSLLLLLILASCVGPSREKQRRPIARPPATQPEDPRILRQCLADLGALGVRYQQLPDRYFPGGCSATGAVKLLDIGLPMTTLGALKCGLARPFAIWAGESIQRAARAWLDSDVVKVETFGTYSCRPINGQTGNKLSEHGRANAVDISAFLLADGRRITVKDGWNGADENIRRFLRAIHSSACRRFQIVLGPDANALHRDHFHFDMGRGPYCR